MSEASSASAISGKVSRDSAAYAMWKRYGVHLGEYACEFVGTAWLMFAIVGVVALMFSQASPMHRWIPSTVARLCCAGALIGSSGSLFTITPMGKLSGAHLNPAMSAGFWLLGKMHLKDFAGYVIAQLAGALLGSVIARIVFGAPAAQVDQAALHQPPAVSLMICLAGESAATFVYCYGIYFLVSHKHLQPWTPLINVPLASAIVGSDGNISGAGFNPARWFGPATITHTWAVWWVWLVAPMVAAALAAQTRKLGPIAEHTVPGTAKLFHDVRYRSIFKQDKLPSTPPPDTAAAPAAANS